MSLLRRERGWQNNREEDDGGWAKNRKQLLAARKKRRGAPQKRILMLSATIIIVFAVSNLNQSRQESPVLRGLDYNEAARQALVPGAPSTDFAVFSYQTDIEEPWLRVACYSLNTESGQWHLLRGGELRLESNGKMALSFDSGRALWAAFFTESDECFAQMNPEEAGHGQQYTSVFWWRRERTPIVEGQAFALCVQTVFTPDAPEDAEPIDPRDAHDPILLRNRENILAAYALTLEFMDNTWQ